MKTASDTPLILCAGRLYCDLVFTGVPGMPVMGQEVFSQGLTLHAGGGALITAATFEALGWHSALISVLPASPFDAPVRGDIAAVGIDGHLCVSAALGLSPQITVAIASGDDRAFLSHKAGAALPPVDLVRDEILQGMRHLHIGELRSLQEHPELIDLARGAGLTISLDCGWDTELLAMGASLAPLIAQVDVFLPNAAEYQRLCEAGLNERAAPLTVVKCGSRGSSALGPDGWTDAPSKPVKVIDATGAGDAFNGGFLAGWLDGRQLVDCLKAGNHCGAAAVGLPGGTAGLEALGAQLSMMRV
ncbi:carbohydrate kinase family protein [Roseibium marinum]|uniref:Carbohydrate kinase PfkB domain-containing protein n=1 Tax=Roseibium marinum TaxID=281252 RepID=A0A2S3UWR0_9HYPH|nr:carbohydrate kinase family protein [Roseibium marinum]POF32114.1 hypothetical protein CLV41_10333 [Roseibium marinum]